MGKSVRVTLTVAVICVAAAAGAFAIYRYHTSRRSAAEQAYTFDSPEERERFIAKFDSLKEVQLYPAATGIGAFAKSRFDANREEWVLRVDSGDWQRRPEVSKKEAISNLYKLFRKIREEAGGDPEAAKLIVVNEAGEGLFSCGRVSRASFKRPIGLVARIELMILGSSIAVPTLLLVFLKRRRKETVVVVLSLAISILVLEVFIKHFYPQFDEHDKMFEHDKELGWRFVPDKRGAISYITGRYHYVETNSWGFRDGPPPSDDGEMTKIMVLGDSFVSNVTVSDSAVFTEIMERQLENTAVLNFGVNGYGQAQEYLLLQEWFPKINPDIVILVIYVRNDFDDNMGGQWLYPRPVANWNKDFSKLTIKAPPPRRPSTESTHERILSFCKTSHFYSLMSKRLKVLVRKYTRKKESEHEQSLDTPPELYLCRRRATKSTRLLYRTMEALLLTISQYVEERGVPIIFVVAPSFVQVDSDVWISTLVKFDEEARDYREALPNRRLMGFAKANNLMMIDLLPVLRAAQRKGLKPYNYKQQHWNDDGNRIVAGTIVEYLRSAGLVDTPAS